MGKTKRISCCWNLIFIFVAKIFCIVWSDDNLIENLKYNNIQKTMYRDISKRQDKIEYSGFTKQQENEILQLHNEYRSKTIPPAADMYELKWSEELAKLAKDWADKCLLMQGPRKCLPMISQNIYNGLEGYKEALSDWYDEVRGYSYEYNVCRNIPCLHYKTMIWATIFAVGCSTADCIDSKNSTMIVCNYYPKVFTLLEEIGKESHTRKETDAPNVYQVVLRQEHYSISRIISNEIFDSCSTGSRYLNDILTTSIITTGYIFVILT
ncbi:cysteine-rich secretory protein LCCL domain-containing 2-like isoform X1 [Centruroides sculpturatus]|uniref:cysteine-rich secretory protein LCCL domain-containing 2-like isoform X1 n=1 Tax=Centruroides sculpturatus TaxID=218467 RepID=UPI000C6CF917|nr:cysteine-rich secretory protein LCCL domain-containing 2-like isoform X1 [Centruroides sculpturatus]